MPIVIEKLTHIYMQGTPFESAALSDVSLTIEDGEFVCIIGHTGSGKSTLIQHINGLIKPASGRVLINGVDFTQKGVDKRLIRQNVGIVFQYPEQQLFEETVGKDVAFGPKNAGLSSQEVETRVRSALKTVGLDYDEVQGRSPFELSGGQRRRAAVAGVLAMQPKILILDEPIAGLDPKGRDDMMELLMRIHREESKTMIMVSHNMDDVARMATKVAVMEKGRLVMYDTPQNVFSRRSELRRMGLDIPTMSLLAEQLSLQGVDTEGFPLDLEHAAQWIINKAGRGK